MHIGIQQGLGTIPENSVYMTHYDRKGLSICKEQANEEKKFRPVEEKHMKCQQYRERLVPRIARGCKDESE